MVYHIQPVFQKIIPFGVFSLFMVILLVSPVSAADTSGSVIGRYDGWDVENSPTVGAGIFPTVTIEPLDESSQMTPSSSSAKTGSVWVTISPFTATLSGQETFMIAGYLSGSRNGVTLTIEGRGGSDADYSDLTTIKPDENGLFVWAVPATYQNRDLFRVTAKSGTSQYLSNAVRFSNATIEPVIKPVVTPVQTVVSMVSSTKASLPTPTRLSIDTRTTMPKVGDDIEITGRLTDMDGKGINGATVSIDETGYPAASGSDPLMTVVTNSDGSFETSLAVKYVNTVGLVATFAGDTLYLSAESNTLFFVSHE